MTSKLHSGAPACLVAWRLLCGVAVLGGSNFVRPRKTPFHIGGTNAFKKKSSWKRPSESSLKSIWFHPNPPEHGQVPEPSMPRCLKRLCDFQAQGCWEPSWCCNLWLHRFGVVDNPPSCQLKKWFLLILYKSLMVTTECHSCIDCSLTYTSEQKNFDPTKTATQLLDSNSPLVHEGIEQCTLTLKPGKAAARGNFGVTGRGFAGMLHDTLHLGHADSPSECVDFVVFQNESKNWSLALTFRKGLINPFAGHGFHLNFSLPVVHTAKL